MAPGASETLQNAASAKLDLRLLGPVEAFVDGSPAHLGGPKQRAVLALLLLDAGRSVSLERLVDEVWGERPPRTARSVVQTYVSELRAALPGLEIEGGAAGYLARVPSGSLDLTRFERLTSAGEEALRTGDAATAADRFGEALDVWRGPALGGLELGVGGAHAARLDELRLLAVEQRCEAELELGRAAELVPGLEAAVAEHPLRERLRAQLMLALYRAGRQAEALAVFRDARRALVEELGIEPSRSLRELESAILRQDEALDRPVEAPERRILAACVDGAAVALVGALGSALGRLPPKEVLLVRVVGGPQDVASAAAELARTDDDMAIRTAAFASPDPYAHLARLAAEQDVELLLADGREFDALEPLLASPCDVAVLAGSATSVSPGPVLVPFGGADHDWTAIELGAWLAGAWGTSLRIAGVVREDGDASRLLASASIATQRALGVRAEPLLVEPGPDGLLDAANDAAVVVFGLSERWRRDGLGRARSSVVDRAAVPVLLVRRGLRPGGLAPEAGRTRFTWTVAHR